VKKLIGLMLLYALTSPVIQAAADIVILGLFKDKAILQIDGRSYTLTTGDSTADGIRLIAADSEQAVLEVDGKRMVYTLGAHIGNNYSPPAPGLIVTITPDSQGMFWVNGHINSHHTRFVVDTGATLISMNKHEAVRLGIDYKQRGEPAIAMTASGQDTVYIVNLGSVYVGEIQLDNVAAAVHDSDFPQVILLGNSFLNRVSMKRDGQVLQLVK